MNRLTLDENAKQDWLNIVKKHKNKQNGAPALSTLNTNAGNVEKSIEIFNKMNSPVESPSNNPISGPFGDSVEFSGEEACCESLNLFEGLNVASPYMLRNDGKVFTCGSHHPYVKTNLSLNNKFAIRILFEREKDTLIWFYKHTQDTDTQLNIVTLIESVKLNKEYYNLRDEDFDCYLAVVDSSDATILSNTFDVETIFELLNQKTNQEFCRFRTSDKYLGGSTQNIFFRISSHGFNWFDLIWKFVYENKSWITHVTIAGDVRSGKEEHYYVHNGVVINELPIEEFITLSGNPIFETIDLQQGIKLSEAYKLDNPYHWVKENNEALKEFFSKNFVKESIMNRETITLYYPELEVTDVPTGKVFRGNQFEPDEYETTDVTIPYDYEVDKQSVYEFLQGMPELIAKYHLEDVSSETSKKFMDTHFDELVEEFNEEIREYFEEDAADHARNNWDESYFEPDWDMMPGGHDDYRIDESKKENVVDDSFDMSLRTFL